MTRRRAVAMGAATLAASAALACREDVETMRVEAMTRERAQAAAAQDFVLEPLRGSTPVIYLPPPDLSRSRIIIPHADSGVQPQDPRARP